ncbi:MAG TPA: FHA domain-containing protein [Methanomicrobiales archaeon]|jgi:DNA-binding transcriptional ArsR family regulator|nr:FHA domain-containing protein [Methanomicrobiales archaeon]
MGEDRATDTISVGGENDLIEEISAYLDVLSSSTRLRILKLLEKKPMDTTSISRGIETSYENTKKHLERLLSLGIIRKEAGLGRETSKGVHPVWVYSLVPGSLEAIIRTLGAFSNLEVTGLDRGLDDRLSRVRVGVSSELLGGRPVVVVAGGSDDGKIFPISDGETRLGRRDPGRAQTTGGVREIVLDDSYKSVTRISRPHGRITLGQDLTYEDCGSTSGSSLNGMKVGPRNPVPLRSGDILVLGTEISGARLILAIPPFPDPSTKRPG